ncbi:putative carboxylesterase 17 [Acorus calamus]|uniref:Carboxylesterase 17 n=1 Tax=Acorus calamus TaxID=4465 RepID=A0AAV9EF28_ACOCL|nr:putative carboxylesterase 17 [Acorus calamus]
MAAAAATAVVVDIPPFIKVYSDGSVTRTDHDPVPSSPHPSSDEINFISKDVVIDASKSVTARIFSPSEPAPDDDDLLPIILYFHGGGFCIGSTRWSAYHTFLGRLSAESRSLVVSVDFRLAPEHRIPAAYEDCLDSLAWLISTSRTDEPWLRRADRSRVFLAGESAGGNIAHHVALRARGCGGGAVKGVMVVQPYFGSERRLQCEVGEDMWMNDSFWRLSLPVGSTRDHPACDFEKAEEISGKAEWDRFPATKVFVAGADLLRERGVMYAEFLVRKGVDAELIMAEGEPHVYQLLSPASDAAELLRAQMAEFVNRRV